jgi:hypothetical protein
VAIVRFGEDDVLSGAEIPADPAEVARHCLWRDLAWRHATSLAAYDAHAYET